MENKNDELDISINESPFSKPTFTCNFCQKLFIRKSHFECHIRIHTNEVFMIISSSFF